MKILRECDAILNAFIKDNTIFIFKNVTSYNYNNEELFIAGTTIEVNLKNSNTTPTSVPVLLNDMKLVSVIGQKFINKKSNNEYTIDAITIDCNNTNTDRLGLQVIYHENNKNNLIFSRGLFEFITKFTPVIFN